MRTKDAKALALKISEGLLRTTTDLILFTCFFTLASMGKRKSASVGYQMAEEAQQLLEEINYDSIKRALTSLKHRGFIQGTRRLDLETMQITKEGRARLHQLLPSYKAKRTWDGRLYLVTYDIPESQKHERELLRSFLKTLGGAMLQESVWLIPYNPREIIRTFVDDRDLAAVVIVSDMGRDGAIGEEDVKTLIRRIYHLDELNERYDEFIGWCDGQKRMNPLGAAKFLSILHDDPQLPFPLLPDDWRGDEAYKLYRKLYGDKIT